MLDEISRQLYDAQQKVLRLQKIDRMLEDLKQQKQAVNQKAATLKEIMEKENQDVEKLQGKNLTHMFHSMLGDLDEKLQKEQQEALSAKLKYDQTMLDLNTMEQQISELAAEREHYLGSDAMYQELYAKKKSSLLQSNSQTAQRIMYLSEQVNAVHNSITEIGEAIHAGENVMEHLRSAMDSLDDAEGWGTWDMLGGGLFSDMMKHSHIDDAKSEVEKTQMALLRFRTELADIRIDSSISIDTDGFGKFADFFFDGLIADWSMQSKIHDSQESVEQVRSQVETVLKRLNAMIREMSLRIEQLEHEIDETIVS